MLNFVRMNVCCLILFVLCTTFASASPQSSNATDAKRFFEQGKQFYLQGDMQRAFPWFMKAAQMSSAEAELQVGWHYNYGKGVPQNYERAAYWYRRSAEHGDSIAMRNLGNLYLYGDGVPRNWGSAYYWYWKSAEAGDEKGQQLLAALKSNVNAVLNPPQRDLSTPMSDGFIPAPVDNSSNIYYNPVFGRYQDTRPDGFPNGTDRDLDQPH